MDLPSGDGLWGIIGGWLATLLGYAVHQGRQSQKINDLKEAVEKMQNSFVDSDGNNRLMSVNECLREKDHCKERIVGITTSFEKFEMNANLRDTEIFTRIRNQEEATIKILTLLEGRYGKKDSKN